MPGGMGYGGFNKNYVSKGRHEKVKLNRGMLKRLIRYAAKYWYAFAVSLLMITVVSFSRLARPYLIKRVIDEFMYTGVKGEMPAAEAVNGIRYVSMLFLGLILLEFFFNYGHVYLLHYTGKKIIMELRDRVFSHIQKLPLSFFDKNPAGRLVTRVTNDTDALNQMYTNVVVGFLQNIIMMAGIIAIMFSLDYRLTLVSFLILPVMVAVVIIFRKKAREVFTLIRNRLAAINAFLSEHIPAMKIIQAFNMEDSKFRQFEKVNRDYYDASMKRVQVFGLFRPFMDVVKSLALSLLLWYGGGRIIQGRLEFGTLYAFVNYINMFFQPVMQLTEQYNLFQGAMVASDRIFRLLDTPVEPHPSSPAVIKEIKGGIVFKNVWFAYVGEDWVLKDVSFDISPGESVAFVGATGAGKTSVINLICGFYENQKGRILVDGIDIKDMDRKTLRSSIGLVLQDVFLFSGSILDNIRLFDGSADGEEAKKAAEYVNAHEFINDMPDGYMSPVNERGTILSMGQRQLVSFARAVIRDPAILVMDEATSSIDTETEGLIQQALERIMRGRTCIAVAHRLSTIQKADRIIVLHKGKLGESGTHQELLAENGLYHELYRLQFAKPFSQL